MKNDGGPAFPQPVENIPYWDPTEQRVRLVHIPEYEGRVQPGMSLRDYFAAKALQGILADGTTQPTSTAEEFAVNVSRAAYAYADAMLAAREATNE